MGLFLFSNWEPVYEFSMKCYKCGKKTIVYYPEDTAYHHFDIPTLDILYSNTQKDNTIGNKCSHCGAYQGNWFVHNEFVHEMYDEDTNLILYPAGVKELNPICARCGKKVDYEVPIKEIMIFVWFTKSLFLIICSLSLLDNITIKRPSPAF